MVILTISKKLTKGKEDLVILQRKKYEALLFREPRLIDEEPLTADERQALKRARKNLKAGKLLSFDAFSKKLGFKNS